MEHNQRIQNFPVSFFSVILGLAGLTISTQKMEEIFQAGTSISTILFFFTITVFSLLAVIYTAKLVFHRSEVVKEFDNPIKLSFFPTISISLLLISVALLGFDKQISFFVWSAGTIMHFVFTLTIISIWIQHTKFEKKHFSPVWFIPAVGNILVPVAGVAHGFMEISWFFFSVGFAFWVILLIIFFNRIIFHHPMPEKLLPTLFILIAPPAIGFISLVKLTGNLDSFARILYYFALFLTMLLIFQFRLFYKIRFYLSWWAYSFPISAITIATVLMYHQTKLPIFRNLGIVLWLILVSVISVLIYKTIGKIVKKQICVED